MGELTFYFDRCFGRRFPEALFRANPPFKVEFHHSPKNRFPQNMPDDKWLSVIGAKDWIVFSHDRRFHTDLPAVAAIKQHSIGCFYLWGAEVQTWGKLRHFMRASERLMEAAANTPKPFLFYCTKGFRLSKIRIP